MGFIGLGGQGTGHLLGGAWTYLTGGYLARPEVQVLATCDLVEGKRNSARDRVNQYYAGKFGKEGYRACEAYLDFRDVLARPEIDAVLIATPIHWHAPMTILAAKAGKDVYCEKPTSMTIAEGQAAVEALRRHARVFQGGTQQRSEYGGKFLRACELVRNGRIGRLKEVYACIEGGGGLLPKPTSAEWELFLGPAPWRPAGGFDAHLFGFGGINWGQHHFDIVQWGMGMDHTGPVEIYRENGKQAFKYANGVVLYGCFPPNAKIGGTGGAWFIGTEGRIGVDREHLVADPPSILEKPLGPNDVPLYHCDSHSGNFLDCINTRKRTICDAGSTHRAASLMLLGGIEMKLRRPLKWDPQKEEFIGDDEANRLRSYAWRQPWHM